MDAAFNSLFYALCESKKNTWYSKSTHLLYKKR